MYVAQRAIRFTVLCVSIGSWTLVASQWFHPSVSFADTFADSGQVLCGIDVLQRDGFQLLKGKRVGLITNQTGLNLEGLSTIHVLHTAPEVQLVALFSPEHGLEGKLDVARIQNSQEASTGLKVHSLYGETRTPTDSSLQEIDALVFDIQDIGARFYTYISTMGNAMRAAANHQVEFVVLDRPNPINGVDVAGPVLDAGQESFVAFHRLPVQHGMTVGELARMFQGELALDLKLTVVQVEGWNRADYFDQTGLWWVNPSPNMRSLTEAYCIRESAYWRQPICRSGAVPIRRLKSSEHPG